MPSHLPTHKLELARIPAEGAEDRDIIRFAQTYNGYKADGKEGVRAMAARLKAEGFQDFTVDELRLALFGRQRAHYHQGGGWPGQPDTLMIQMRELTTDIRQRVAAGEHLTQVPAGPEIRVWTGDITTLHVDAIVNAANTSLLGGGGVDGAIHRAAGPKLLEACREIHELRPGVRCPTGQARITRGVKLPARHVIHAVGPRWHGGEHGEDDALASAYRSSLGLAEAHQLEAIAIPAISTGVYGFPPARAARIAVETIRAWQGREHPVWVTLVGFDEAASHILRAALAGERDAKP